MVISRADYRLPTRAHLPPHSGKGARGRRGRAQCRPHAWIAVTLPRPARQEMTADQQPEEINAYLQDVGGQFSGASIKVVTEDTPPGSAISNLKEALLKTSRGSPSSGKSFRSIRCWPRSATTRHQAGANDIYYFDQAWVGRFINDTFDPRELFSQAGPRHAELQHRRLPAPLVVHIASYGGKMIGFPCDVPIFMYLYRRTSTTSSGSNRRRRWTST